MFFYLGLKIRRFIAWIDGSLRLALDKVLPKNLTVRYIIALSVVAALAITGQMIIQTSLLHQTKDQKKLRSLQTQIHDSENLRKAALTLQLISRRPEIKSQTDLIEFLSVRLQKNDDLFDFSYLDFDDKNPATVEMAQAVDKSKKNLNGLIRDCQILSSLTIVQKPEYRLSTVTVRLLNHEAAYRTGLWQISRHYERKLRRQITEFKRIELLLLCTTLLVLIIEALYVFRPAVENLYEALRTRSDFLGRMGHEMRNPMNSILGMVNLLFETPLTDQQKKYLSILHKSSGGLLDMLNNLLDFSSIESGTLKVEKISFDFYKLLEKSIDLAVYGAHANGIELVLDLSPNVPLKLEGDPGRVQQVLTNLLGNAVKFTKQGEVVLSIQLVKRSEKKMDEAYIQFSVVDTGIGIDKKKTTRIFNAFVQEDSTVRRRFGGVGLGLAISQELVELLGGKLEVESQKNLGSRFFFTVPFRVTEEFSVDEIIRQEKLPSFVARIMEPNEKILAALTCVITQSGGTVESIKKTKDLEAAFSRTIVDRGRAPIMIIDYEFSKDSLPELFSRIRRGEIATTPFIFLIKTTASSKDIEKLAEYGIRNFIFKPVKPLQLIKAIKDILVDEVSEDAPFSEDIFSPRAVKGVDSPPDRRALRILAVDDSKDNQFLVKAYLAALPYRITYAENGRIAVENFKDAKFDIVLMDLQMPEMDGYTAVRLIREWEKSENLQPTPIIAVSAHDNESSSDRFRNSQFSSYLVKPISPAQLRREIIQNTKNVPAENPAPQTNMDDINSQIASLAPKYLSNRRQEVEELKKLLVAQDFEKIQTLGHRLKGNAKSYGFEELGLIGARLEETAKVKDGTAIGALIEEMVVFLAKV